MLSNYSIWLYGSGSMKERFFLETYGMLLYKLPDCQTRFLCCARFSRHAVFFSSMPIDSSDGNRSPVQRPASDLRVHYWGGCSHGVGIQDCC